MTGLRAKQKADRNRRIAARASFTGSAGLVAATGFTRGQFQEIGWWTSHPDGRLSTVTKCVSSSSISSFVATVLAISSRRSSR